MYICTAESPELTDIDPFLTQTVLKAGSSCIKELSEIELFGSDNSEKSKSLKLKFNSCNSQSRQDCFSNEEIKEKLRDLDLSLQI